jgi:D-aminoacyl-tRNA deacylase
MSGGTESRGDGMKGAILYSTQNAASMNIMKHLELDWSWKEKNGGRYAFSACGKDKCCTAVEAAGVDREIIAIVPSDAKIDADYFLYASSHKSEVGKPALTAHIPGNWSKNEMGGDERTLNMAYACKLKQILQLLSEGNKKHGLNWPVNMEVDHHGPTPNNGKEMLIFVEIGSKKEEWENDLAGKVVAEAMMKALCREAPVVPVYLGFGGGHYSPKFTPLMIEGEKAVGHILPKYQAENFDAVMLKQAIGKTHEEVEGALVDWKGLPGEHRDRIITLIEEEGLKWQKI